MLSVHEERLNHRARCQFRTEQGSDLPIGALAIADTMCSERSVPKFLREMVQFREIAEVSVAAVKSL